jgi:hypothetical protein
MRALPSINETQISFVSGAGDGPVVDTVEATEPCRLDTTMDYRAT